MTAIAIPFLLFVWLLGILTTLHGLREAQREQSASPLLIGLACTAMMHGFLAWALLHV